MKITPLDISGLFLITPREHRDQRGVFMESYRRDLLSDALGRRIDFVQDNQSVSYARGTVRGLHMQKPPRAQVKLVRCAAGSVLDVAVDIRKTSPTFGQHVAVQLSADNAQQLFIPAGFLHGFITLQASTIVAYKCSDYFSPEHDMSVRFDSPALGIDWGALSDDAVLSDKDRAAPDFADFESPFS